MKFLKLSAFLSMFATCAVYADVANILGYTLGQTTYSEVVKDYRLEPIPKHLNDFCDNCQVYALRGKDKAHKSKLEQLGAVFLSFCNQKSALIQVRIHVRPNINVTEVTRTLVDKYKVQDLAENKASIPGDLYKKLPFGQTISYQDEAGNYIFYVAGRASPLLIYAYPDVSAQETQSCFSDDIPVVGSDDFIEGLVTSNTMVIDTRESY